MSVAAMLSLAFPSTDSKVSRPLEFDYVWLIYFLLLVILLEISFILLWFFSFFFTLQNLREESRLHFEDADQNLFEGSASFTHHFDV